MDFDTATQLNALAVADGNLLAPYSLGDAVVALLQRVNRAGLLTTRSAHGERTDDRDERAVVEGFMDSSQAPLFVDAFNTSTDKVAVVLHPTSDTDLAARVPVAFEHGLTHATIDMSRRKSQIEAMRKGVGLSAEASVVYVVSFDPLWGRPSALQDGLLSDMSTVLASM